MMKRTRKSDAEHLRNAYALLKECIDELAQVYYKDSVIARVFRELGTLEDILYQMISGSRRAI